MARCAVGVAPLPRGAPAFPPALPRTGLVGSQAERGVVLPLPWRRRPPPVWAPVATTLSLTA
eukprot:15378585-Alexandrium_andersonii.AAC.1